jgi:hypothetical protein
MTKDCSDMLFRNAERNDFSVPDLRSSRLIANVESVSL